MVVVYGIGLVWHSFVSMLPLSCIVSTPSVHSFDAPMLVSHHESCKRVVLQKVITKKKNRTDT
jgi:hypothetical protein